MRLISILTATVLTLTVNGCAFVRPHIGEYFQESCQSHAYSQIVLLDYIQNRFTPGAPVRIGVLPATTPANMNHFFYEHPNAGVVLSNRIHQDLLNYGTLPIVEMFNRQEWPGKREEFFSGNFGAIRLAREAGYDFVVTTYIEPMRDIDKISAYSRVIETSSGTTIYYGKSTALSNRRNLNRTIAAGTFGLAEDEKHSMVPTNYLFDKLGQCISQAIMKESTTPK